MLPAVMAPSNRMPGPPGDLTKQNMQLRAQLMCLVSTPAVTWLAARSYGLQPADHIVQAQPEFRTAASDAATELEAGAGKSSDAHKQQHAPSSAVLSTLSLSRCTQSVSA